MTAETSPASFPVTRILVLGIGNLLLKDEGIGVHVIQQLQERCTFSENVTLMDGGTLGPKLLPAIEAADRLIVVDALRMASPPGTIHRLSRAELRSRIARKSSMHQIDFFDTMTSAEMLGVRPKTTIIGVEPEDISPWGTELTQTVAARVREVIEMVCEEIGAAGGRCERRKSECNGKSVG